MFSWFTQPEADATPEPWLEMTLEDFPAEAILFCGNQCISTKVGVPLCTKNLKKSLNSGAIDKQTFDRLNREIDHCVQNIRGRMSVNSNWDQQAWDAAVAELKEIVSSVENLGFPEVSWQDAIDYGKTLYHVKKLLRVAYEAKLTQNSDDQEAS